MLFIVATPIGNLSDFSQRAISVLQSCDYVLCEDTRHSRILLNHHGIDKRLISYHQHNEASRIQELLCDLKKGKQIALLSDAGTPGISDPGHRIVSACHNEGIKVVPIPGACALIAALSASPLPTERFQFIGFLPKTPLGLTKELEAALEYTGTTACYESPSRLVKTLQALCKLAPEAPVAVCRELTKLHEDIRAGTPQSLLDYYTAHPAKGEIVLLIGHCDKAPPEIDPAALILQLEKEGLSKQESLKKAAKILKIPRNALYQQLLIRTCSKSSNAPI